MTGIKEQETGPTNTDESRRFAEADIRFVHVMADASSYRRTTGTLGDAHIDHKQRAQDQIVEGVIDFIGTYGEIVLGKLVEEYRDLGERSAYGVTSLEPYIATAQEKIRVAAEAVKGSGE